MIKDIFYFTKADRRALVILCVCIIALTIIKVTAAPVENAASSESEIIIDSTVTVAANKTSNKFKTKQMIDLNAADTTLLQRIPGIGHGFSNGIVIRRQKLGGYYSVDQLSEINRFPDSLKTWFYIVPDSIKKIRINTASVARMKEHPYITFYQAKAIEKLRQTEGKIQSPARLKLLEEFSAQDLERLSPYISYE